MKFLALFALFFVVDAASLRTQNGTFVEPNQLPFLVFLKHVDLTGRVDFEYGVGTLISDQYVLTSYLATVVPKGLITLILGANNWKVNESSQVRFEVPQEDLIYMKPFEPERDLALIKLPTKVNFTEAIQPIQLPRWSDVDLDYANEKALVAGWGPRNRSEESNEPLDKPNYTEVQVLPKTECEVFPNDVICITRQMSSIHEEGSPVFTHDHKGFHQIALEAGFGFFTEKGEPRDVYIRLNKSKNLSWIANNSNVKIESWIC